MESSVCQCVTDCVWCAQQGVMRPRSRWLSSTCGPHNSSGTTMTRTRTPTSLRYVPGCVCVEACNMCVCCIFVCCGVKIAALQLLFCGVKIVVLPSIIDNADVGDSATPQALCHQHCCGFAQLPCAREWQSLSNGHSPVQMDCDQQVYPLLPSPVPSLWQSSQLFDTSTCFILVQFIVWYKYLLNCCNLLSV